MTLGPKAAKQARAGQLPVVDQRNAPPFARNQKGSGAWLNFYRLLGGQLAKVGKKALYIINLMGAEGTSWEHALWSFRRLYCVNLFKESQMLQDSKSSHQLGNSCMNGHISRRCSGRLAGFFGGVYPALWFCLCGHEGNEPDNCCSSLAHEGGTGLTGQTSNHGFHDWGP